VELLQKLNWQHVLGRHQQREFPMNKLVVMLLVAATLALIAPASYAFTVGGAVRQPLNLSCDDLARFVATDARLADFTRDKVYNGVFDYQGVPLQALLRTATIRKTGDGFNKNIDLAIVVRNSEGMEVVLSWGEVFYKNPSNVMVAFSSVPVMPHRTDVCGKCHTPDFYQPALDKLKRKVGLPKLVLANDFYSDRSLEDIVSITVVDLMRGSSRKPDPEPSAAKFTVTDVGGKTSEFTDLGRFSHRQVDFKNIGDGRGFHGLRQFDGAPLREILAGLDPGQEPDKFILVTSTDGYQGLFSFGEIFLAPLGERIIISERNDAAKGKSFSLVVPDDTAADRMIKNICKIEVFSLKKKTR
jgi:hypothetical protein